MHINGVEIEDTFAEAFGMWGSRLIVTGDDLDWARTAAEAATGFATSIIGCGCEAGTNELAPDEQTPDGRPGVAALVFTTSRKNMEATLLQRVGQAVMTSATSACYDGLAAEEKVKVGGKLRYFGDGFQRSKLLDGRRLWRVPVMDGEFVVEESFGVVKAVGGGNFFMMAQSLDGGARRGAGGGGRHARRAGRHHAVSRRRRAQRQQDLVALQGSERLEQHPVSARPCVGRRTAPSEKERTRCSRSSWTGSAKRRSRRPCAWASPPPACPA